MNTQLSLFDEHSDLSANEPITHSLIIREPWANMILSGNKTIEIRGTNTKKRGPIAIISGGSGTITGIAHLTDVIGPLSLDDYNHMITTYGGTKEKETSLPYKRTYAWQLSAPRKLPSPLPYTHPNGAVIWVKLDEEVREGLRCVHQSTPPINYPNSTL